MANILPMIEADSISFEPSRDREAHAGVIEEGRIAGAVETPLPNEHHRPDPS